MKDEPTVLARVLKRTRRARGWTLADVADRSGISITTLSKVERGIQSLTYEKIVDLARGLDVEIGSLFSDRQDVGAPSARRSLTRAGDGVRSETGTVSCVYLNTDLITKSFYPLLYELKARSLEEFGAMTAHDGDQLVHVLEGELEIHTEHYEPVRLRAGDTFYFDSAMRHAAFRIGDAPCRLFGVLSALDTRGVDAIQASRAGETDLHRSRPARDPTPLRSAAKRETPRPRAAAKRASGDRGDGAKGDTKVTRGPAQR